MNERLSFHGNGHYGASRLQRENSRSPKWALPMKRGWKVQGGFAVGCSRKPLRATPFAPCASKSHHQNNQQAIISETQNWTR
jgi:hypothetical protein